MSLIDALDARFYPQFTDNWDDILFRKKLLEFIQQDSQVLDLGAGAGIIEAMNFRDIAKRVCGIDLDPRVNENPFLDEGVLADAGQIPYPDESFDIVFADNVMEHIRDPQKVFKEIFRTLRPGGRFLFKTPNKTHYMPIIAQLTPHSFHEWINRKRGRDRTDTFPTFYNCNTQSDVQCLAKQAGLEVEKFDLLEGRPEYMRISAPTYLLGLAYERLVNATAALQNCRILIIATLSKPDNLKLK